MERNLSIRILERNQRKFDYLVRIIHLECINIPIHIRINIAELMGGPIYIERLKNGWGSNVTFRGIPVYSISDSGTRYLPSDENILNKNKWIRNNIKDISNLDKIENLFGALELYNDFWIVTKWNFSSNLPCYLSHSGRYKRPAELDMLKDYQPREEKKQEISRRYIRKDYSLIPGTESYALKHMRKNNLNYCIYIIWGLEPSMGYSYDLDLVEGKWCNKGKSNWFIGYAGKYDLFFDNKYSYLIRNIKKGVLTDILNVVRRRMFGRINNGQYLDHYYIYGKTLNELITNVRNELERYRNILIDTVGYDFVFSPFYIKYDGKWEDKLRKIAK
jgi:hypothetical protein